MEQRIKIKHDGPRGWAGIARSAFDPDIHELYEGEVAASVIEPSGDAVAITGIKNRPDAEAQLARMNLADEQINAMGKDELRQQLDGMGADFDARWGEAKLRAALIDAIAEVRA